MSNKDLLKQIKDLLDEVVDFLDSINLQIEVGSDVICPGCNKKEFHHSTCELIELRDKAAEMAEI